MFWIDVSKLSTVQLGLMLLTCENIREFGGGINAGYGRVEPQEITLVQRNDGYEKMKIEGGYKLFPKLEELQIDVSAYDQAVASFVQWVEKRD